MGANIEWAYPKITECWAFYGRLYRSKKKAEYERNGYLNSNQRRIDAGQEPFYKNIPPIYKITWTWEEDNG